MTVVQNVLIGRSKQKIGNAVFTTWKGINVLKSKPITVENPNTINQQMRRTALSDIVGFYRAISNVVTVGWKELAIGKSEYNAFVSYNLKNAIDYSAPPAATSIPANGVISKGTIMKQNITSATATGATDTIVVNWSAAVLQPGQAATDKALLVVVNETAGTYDSFVTSVSRSANTLSQVLTNPVTAADVMSIYLGFYNPTTYKAGDSDYISANAV